MGCVFFLHLKQKVMEKVVTQKKSGRLPPPHPKPQRSWQILHCHPSLPSTKLLPQWLPGRIIETARLPGALFAQQSTSLASLTTWGDGGDRTLVFT